MLRRISTIDGDAWTLARYCATCGAPIWEPMQGDAPSRSSCSHTATDAPTPDPVPVIADPVMPDPMPGVSEADDDNGDGA